MGRYKCPAGCTCPCPNLRSATRSRPTTAAHRSRPALPVPWRRRACTRRRLGGDHVDQARRFAPCQGAVTLIQRFESVAKLNVHLHYLMLDGVYGSDGNDLPRRLRLRCHRTHGCDASPLVYVGIAQASVDHIGIQVDNSAGSLRVLARYSPAPSKLSTVSVPYWRIAAPGSLLS